MGSDLSDARLWNVECEGGNWSYVNLRMQSLAGWRAPGIVLRGADLYQADLTGADLTGADLTEANLEKVKLKDADLRGADLTRTNLAQLVLEDTLLDFEQCVLFAVAHGARVE